MNKRKVFNEARLLLLAIPILIWTIFPIYHMFLFDAA
jgi:multiple sugar transport system permease protein